MYVADLVVAEHRQHDAGEDPARRSPTTARSRGDTGHARNYDEARQVMDDLAEARHRLRRRDRRPSSSEGVDKFVASWDELVETVEGQLEGAKQ